MTYEQLELFRYEKVPYGHCPRCYKRGSIDRDHLHQLFCIECKTRVEIGRWETVVRHDFPYILDTNSIVF
ncbi:hypothetical protein HUN41_00237 [Streptomyces phage Coruscant]|uniref:Uncharacterized protein n=1 Tax=Streptomyces phage Coruscant TaxID=2739834 RepID=A0A7G4AWD6_9CAUD|nr:hypothetical protein PP454_gp091 [Streptomyces phage Coruscant]QMP84326.1 hypothetical protein HUN41_00237 [Streptomyces phage Coruscant]